MWKKLTQGIILVTYETYEIFGGHMLRTLNGTDEDTPIILIPKSQDMIMAPSEKMFFLDAINTNLLTYRR